MATHSRILAWKIPWTEEPGGLKSMGSLRVGHDWAILLSLFTFMHWRRKWQPTAVWRIPGMAEPGRLPSMGSHRVRHNWSDLAAAAAAAGIQKYKLFLCIHLISSNFAEVLIKYQKESLVFFHNSPLICLLSNITSHSFSPTIDGLIIPNCYGSLNPIYCFSISSLCQYSLSLKCPTPLLLQMCD